MSESLKQRKATLKRAAGNIASGLVLGQTIRGQALSDETDLVRTSIRLAQKIDVGVEALMLEEFSLEERKALLAEVELTRDAEKKALEQVDYWRDRAVAAESRLGERRP